MGCFHGPDNCRCAEEALVLQCERDVMEDEVGLLRTALLCEQEGRKRAEAALAKARGLLVYTIRLLEDPLGHTTSECNSCLELRRDLLIDTRAFLTGQPASACSCAQEHEACIQSREVPDAYSYDAVGNVHYLECPAHNEKP